MPTLKIASNEKKITGLLQKLELFLTPTTSMTPTTPTMTPITTTTTRPTTATPTRPGKFFSVPIFSVGKSFCNKKVDQYWSEV